jgi:hypothetical protein
VLHFGVHGELVTVTCSPVVWVFVSQATGFQLVFCVLPPPPCATILRLLLLLLCIAALRAPVRRRPTAQPRHLRLERHACPLPSCTQARWMGVMRPDHSPADRRGGCGVQRALQEMSEEAIAAAEARVARALELATETEGRAASAAALATAYQDIAQTQVRP